MQKRKKIKNFILKAIMSIVFFVWCYSVCTLDAPSWTPFIVMIVTSAILVAFAYVNGAFGECED